MRLHWRIGARTDVGLVREGNEDSMYAGPRLIAVADGIGGSVAGEIASTIAITRLAPLDSEASIDDPLGALGDAIAAANAELRGAIEQEPQLGGMGTTLTAMLWSDDALGLAQLGDSRAYRLRNGRIDQISRDQTLVQSLVDDGTITPEEALTHPRRSWILRALDGRPESDPELELLPAEVGDRYLLCSDGLSDYVAESDIADALQAPDADTACGRLIDLALNAGAPDNVTCVVADVVENPPEDDAPIIGGAAAEVPPVWPRTATTTAIGAVADPDAAPGGDEPTETGTTRHRSIARRLAAVAAAVVILVAAVVVGVGVYVHHQWYIATSGGKVAVYQGVKGKAAGVHLSHVHSLTDIPVTALPQDDRQRLAGGIQASGQQGAATVVTNLRQEACSLATATTSPLTPATTATTPTLTLSAGATPTSTPTSSPTTSGSTTPPVHGSQPTHKKSPRATVPPWCVAATP
jgi:protein phosphatase